MNHHCSTATIGSRVGATGQPRLPDRWLATRLQRLLATVDVRVQLWDGHSSWPSSRHPIGTLVVGDRRTLLSLRRDGRVWTANEEIRTPLVIGAGGHFCPMARRLRDRAAPSPPVVAKEAEYRLDGYGSTVAPNVAEFFFCHDLDGYGWCVRKGEYLNVGMGRPASCGKCAHEDVGSVVRLLTSIPGHAAASFAARC